MAGKIFLDTNIFIYAHNLDAGVKYEKGSRVIKDIWEKGNGIISTQVLQEFYVHLTKNIADPLSPTVARNLARNYLSWEVVHTGPETIFHASEIEEQYGLSFWDSLIVSAASEAKAEKIFTENWIHGQMIEGMLIENPFIKMDFD